MLLLPNGEYDRREIMSDAHKQYRRMRRFGWTWQRCLKFSWARARAMRELQLLQSATIDPARLPLAA